jgi:GAF domain-containing protein
MSELGRVLEELLAVVACSRVTLRRDDPGDYAFPVVEEALAPGVASLRHERTIDLRRQPVVRELALGRQVVQDDSRQAYDDPAFQAMLDAYGGLAAQIVTPVLSGERLAAIVSVHQLGAPRTWTDEEIGAARAAATRIGTLL